MILQSRRAFTLIELITVMAITAILLTLITLPVFQSFQLTRNAQAFADAQDRGRILSERISREISQSSGVRDLSSLRVWPGVNDGNPVPGHTLVITVPRVNADGTPQQTDFPVQTTVLLPYAKMDLVLPAAGDPTRRDGALIDPTTGKADPTLEAPRGEVNLPVTPGSTIVRWFVGLRRPILQEGTDVRVLPYVEPYSGTLQLRAGREDNLYVLYRAEVTPVIPGGGVNTAFFQDVNNDGVPDDIDDPAFFTMIPGIDFDAGDGSLSFAGRAKALRISNWLRRAVIQTEAARYDMIQPQIDRNTRRVANTAGVPHILGLVQFRPARVGSDAARAETAIRLGQESIGINTVGSDVFTTEFGLWSNAMVRLWPSGFEHATSGANEYLVGRRDPWASVAGRPVGMSIYGFDPDAFVDDTQQGVELFDLAVYEGSVAGASGFAFSDAVRAANNRTGWLSSPRLREIFTPFFTVAARGKIFTSFSISEVGTSISYLGDNLPIAQTGLARSPAQDAGTGAAYSGTGYEINRAFNRAWNENPNLRSGQLHRFIDLRVTPQRDGTPSPLSPTYVANQATGFTRVVNGTRLSRVRLVPGTIEVYGPDQLPGPNYGNRIRYIKTTQEPGPNQYRVVVADLAEPTNAGGAIDYSVLFPGYANPPLEYTPTNFVSAVLQPRFRAGYIQLNSDPNQPLPSGTFEVSYRFQFTGGRSPLGGPDRIAVDYDSRQLMTVLLTVRNFPQANVPNPQSITLSAQATVRNYIR